MHRILAILFAATLSASAVDVDLGSITDLYAVPVSAGQATFTVSTGGGRHTITAGLIARYAFDSNMVDSITANTGNVGTLTYAPGVLGSAVAFNSGSYGSAYNAYLLNGLTNATIAFWWFNYELRTLAGLFVAKGAYNNGAMQQGTDGAMRIIVNTRYATPSIPATNVWQQVSLVYSNVGAGFNIKTYVDGTMVGEATSGDLGPPIHQAELFWIGTDPDSPASRWSHGMMDELLIYNRPLYPSEVQELVDHP